MRNRSEDTSLSSVLSSQLRRNVGVDLHLLLFELRVYGKMDWCRTLALVESVDQGAVLVDYYSTAVPPYCVHCRVYLVIAVERGDNWASFPVLFKSKRYEEYEG